MTIDGGTITWLVIGALLLGALAVVIDRVNFPQKPFRPKRIEQGERGAARDRTGAHIVEVSEEEWDQLEDRKRRQIPRWRARDDGGGSA
ncbi:MAG: hypothetical protein ACR2QO_12520 [Acidimicrobiales bacterium]